MIDEYIKEIVRSEVDRILKEKFSDLFERKEEKRFAYSLTELAKYLGCGKATVSRWKDEGKFKGCYQQIDRTLIFNLNKIDKKFGK